ncbi:translation initiation factor IF-2 [Kolteria novifilia]|uniref:translation initiation factor IF-2 n=1 Tax=Kolteria novifilia TaxID=2527975 RepID=UPI003AF3FE00
MSKDKVRVYQLARELDVESKDLIELMRSAGIDVKNHMTTLDAETRQVTQDLVAGKVSPERIRGSSPPPPPAAKPKASSPGESIPAPRASRVTQIPRGKQKEDDEEAVDEGAGQETPSQTGSPEPVPVPVEEMVAQEPEKVPEPEPEPTPQPEPVAAEASTPPEEVAETTTKKKTKSPEDTPPSQESKPEAAEERRVLPKRGSGSSAIPDPNVAKPKNLGGGQQGGGAGQRGGQRDRRPSRPTPLVGGPLTAPPKPESQAEKKPAVAAQKPVMRLPADALRSGQFTPPPAVPADAAQAKKGKGGKEGFDEEKPVKRGRGAGGGAAMTGREERQRRRQRSAQHRSFDVEDDDGSSRPSRGSRRPRRSIRHSAEQSGPVVLEQPITIRSFSEAAGIRANEIQRKLMSLGVMATINQALTDEDAEMVAMELGLEIQFKREQTVEEWLEKEFVPGEDEAESLAPRPPVVTFMGHVDHGKTSLMDRIRSTDVAGGESGGITQHIAAYQVKTHTGSGLVTFLDTPGHEAFTAMRARGADATDIVVLVIAADDGVMPQTEEAISHAKAANVGIVVAMNKMDLPSANVEKLQQQLSQHGLIPEEWGGDTLMIGTSATTGDGVEELLDSISILAELKELKSNPNRPATGLCIEASLSEGLGVKGTVLVQHGTLRRGDAILCGSAFGRVRAMFDDHGKPLDEAGPSTPVVLTGLDEVPDAGEKFFVLEDITRAREIAEERRQRAQAESRTNREHVSLETLLDSFDERKVQELRVILKADVRGSLEAIKKEFSKFTHDEVRVRILHEGIGGIGESDILLADASDAIVIGFRVVADDRASALSSEKGVEVRRYEIIYQVSQDIRDALEGMLIPDTKEVQLGRAVVQQTFTISRVGTVAGCRVIEGNIDRNAKMRIIREGTILGSYPIDSLRRVKDDAKEVREGLECGIKLAGFNDVKRGDILEAFKIEEVKRTLDQ